MRPGEHNKGEHNVKAKLTEKEVREIYLYEGDLSQHALADRYGVSQSTVNHIRQGRTWAWLTKTL